MKASTITLLVFLTFLIGTCKLVAQADSDISKILNTAFKDNGVKFKNEKNYHLGSLDYAVPFLEKIEVRSETNDFDLRKQDYTVRVSPNTGSSRKAHRLYHESVKFMAEMELNTEIMKVLYDKYHLVKDYIFAKERLKLENVKNVVVLDKVKLLKKMISLSSFDIVDLIEAEDELYKLQRTIQSIESNLSNLERQLKELLAQDEINISIDDLISVEQIKSFMSLNVLASKTSHPEQEVLSAKHYNVLMEYDWEVSKNNFSIGFIQASYGYDQDKAFGSNFSLGLGFDIPVKGSTGLELNELKVNILDAQNEYLERVDAIELTKHTSESRLNSLILMYELLSIQIEEGNANHALVEYSKQGIASPQAILKLKELTLNNSALLIEIQSDIMETYLDHIYSTGAIGNKPYQNYFDGDLTTL